MGRFFVYLGRLILITIGFSAAALAASATMHLLVLPRLGLSADEAGPVIVAAYAFSIPFVALFVAYFAFLPSLVVIAVAELWSVRNWLFHALGGGAVGVVLAILFRSGEASEILVAGSDVQIIPPGNSIFDLNLLTVMIGAGMVGGLAYWLIAGRNSGSWKAVSISPEP